MDTEIECGSGCREVLMESLAEFVANAVHGHPRFDDLYVLSILLQFVADEIGAYGKSGRFRAIRALITAAVDVMDTLLEKRISKRLGPEDYVRMNGHFG